jgi:hypothetical protein
MPIFVVIIVAILFSVFSALVFAGHFFIYYSIKIFFAVEDKKRKRLVAVILAALAVSFGAASAVAHFSHDPITEVLYFLAGLWLGLAMNLDTALAAGWLVVGFGRIFKRHLNLRMVGIISVAAAIIFTGYGVWNAYNSVTKEITVKIKNLPAAWQNKKIVQLSDVHLGHVFGDWFLERAVREANSFRPEAVFITGDLFDGMDGYLGDYVEPIDRIVAPRGTYFVTGNHETYLGVANTYHALSKTNVKILKDEVVEADGLQIVGVAFPERSETLDVGEVIRKISGFDADRPSILLYHSPLPAGEAKEAGIDLMLSGHTHNGQVLPFNILMRMIFGKRAYGLYQDGDFTLYTTSGLGTWGPTMRTFSRPEIVVITLENRL